MQKTPWAAKTNLKRSAFGRPGFNHVFNCHAVCVCVGNTTPAPPTRQMCVCALTIQPSPHHQVKCVCVRWQYNPPPHHHGKCVCVCVCVCGVCWMHALSCTRALAIVRSSTQQYAAVPEASREGHINLRVYQS